MCAREIFNAPSPRTICSSANTCCCAKANAITRCCPRSSRHLKPPWKIAACLRFFACLLTVFAFACNVRAHNPSKSYLSLTCDTNGISGQWDIPLADLQSAVPLDLNHDGTITWEELRAGYGAVTAYALAHLAINVDGHTANLRITDTEPAIEDFADGNYIRLS